MAFKKGTTQYVPREAVRCAHDICQNDAMLRRKLKNGLANLCKSHDLFHAQQEADDYCRANGLKSQSEKRGFCATKMKQFGRFSGFEHWQRTLQVIGLPEETYAIARNALEKLSWRTREPGDDDELIEGGA